MPSVAAKAEQMLSLRWTAPPFPPPASGGREGRGWGGTPIAEKPASCAGQPGLNRLEGSVKHAHEQAFRDACRRGSRVRGRPGVGADRPEIRPRLEVRGT